jgi:hypothetical protein
MRRREFLKSAAALIAAGAVPAPAIWSPASAQSRQETLQEGQTSVANAVADRRAKMAPAPISIPMGSGTRARLSMSCF